jgi:F420-dependent oxidoreductase-like protein
MDLRVFVEPQLGASYDDQLRVARAAEDLGFEAFFRSDHYLTMGSSDGLPGPTDAWLTLAALARDTSRVRLGTLVSPATFRLPGPLAISVAQVDAMSGGRVELGMGAGWYEREHEAYGIPYPDDRERFDVFSEQVEIVDGLLRTPAGATYSFTGKHYQLVESPALPKPVQSPRPPIILGGSARKRGAALAARFADEFNVAFKTDEFTAGAFDRVRAAAADTGREPVLSVAKVVCVGRNDAEVRARADDIGQNVDGLRANQLAGTPAQALERLESFRAVGASRAYLQLLDMSDIDQLELIAAEVLPHV